MAQSGQKLEDLTRGDNLAWFCIQSFLKRKHIAAAHLRNHGAEVYLPRIRFKRLTRRGVRWRTEPLFPNYCFARFEPQTSLRRMQHAFGVKSVVHFGNHWPTVADEVINALRAAVRGDRPCVVQPEMQTGQGVTIAGGMFHGFEAVVTRVMPARERIAVLMEFLGTQVTLELAGENAASESHHRDLILEQV